MSCAGSFAQKKSRIISFPYNNLSNIRSSLSQEHNHSLDANPSGHLATKFAMKKTSTDDSEPIGLGKCRQDFPACLANNLMLNSRDAQYEEERDALLKTELETSWDANARTSASKVEREAQGILEKIREDERRNPALFGNVPSETVPDPRSRDMGGKYLINLDRINQSRIFDIASKLPKACHQHLHFNSEIPPERLFSHAKSAEMLDTMYIRSTLPLLNPENFEKTEIVFNVLPNDTPKANIFSAFYNPDIKAIGNSPWMLWRDFIAQFPHNKARIQQFVEDLEPAECWAREKMVITVEHTYGETSTHNSSWACFNQGTRAFKGLLGYEGIYRWYIGHAIDSMLRDNVMYAELRPMLLDKTIPTNDGVGRLGHADQLRIICEEVAKKQIELTERGQLDKFRFGLKIIYCTPRSIPRETMQSELEDCIKLKLQFPDLICGFDLVGAEDRPNCINYYADLLVAFVDTCKQLGLNIPFMFHAGETLLDTGGSSRPENSNLYDALLLNAKRIGHGYALLKHPVLVEMYKKQNICLELCPISNELLNLCGNAREHPYPQLLAAGLHCTLNADNPSLFR